MKRLNFLARRRFSSLNLSNIIESYKGKLIPPVNNQMIHDNQLKTMVVSGPNQRTDFHINQGEELFFQSKGKMDLKIAFGDTFRTVQISEGDIFLLPGNIPHSPQRYQDTLGIVFERERLSSEQDSLRWYVPNSSTVLHESTFHCHDLVGGLKTAIQNFTNSSMAKTLIPDKLYPNDPPKCILKDQFANLQSSNLKEILDSIYETRKVILEGNEFKVEVFHGAQEFSCLTEQDSGDLFLWQYSGRSQIHTLFETSPSTPATTSDTPLPGNASAPPTGDLSEKLDSFTSSTSSLDGSPALPPLTALQQRFSLSLPQLSNQQKQHLPPSFILEEGEVCVLPLNSMTDFFVSQLMPHENLIAITNHKRK